MIKRTSPEMDRDAAIERALPWVQGLVRCSVLEARPEGDPASWRIPRTGLSTRSAWQWVFPRLFMSSC